MLIRGQGSPESPRRRPSGRADGPRDPHRVGRNDSSGNSGRGEEQPAISTPAPHVTGQIRPPLTMPAGYQLIHVHDVLVR
jgi:hypothetical protein